MISDIIEPNYSYNKITLNMLRKAVNKKRHSNELVFLSKDFKYKGNIYKMNNTHQKEFKTGYEAWKVNKIFGGGLNSFLKTCQSNNIGNCSNHPHNYYLEILTELGLVGFIILVFLIYIIFYETLIKKYFKKSFLKKNHVITPFIFLFLAEFFPFKSTGSFFTTSSATYIFLIIPIIAALYKTKEID